MKIVVLDGHTLNPGDLDWGGLERLGEFEVYARTKPDEVVTRAAGAEVVLTNKTELREEHFQRLPRLRYVGVLATGTNVVDLAAARKRGIPVTNVPAYGAPSVAQLTFALVLELTHGVGTHSEGVRAGQWTRNLDFSYWNQPLIELNGLTMGIIGLGRIGRAVATIAQAFGMEVTAVGRPGTYDQTTHLAALERALRRSDVLSLHCPLTPETRHLINAESLSWMKPSALLINTSRGGLVDEPALAEALNTGRIAGAGLDVLSVEPPPAENPLLHAKNCVITPHLGWGTRAARQRLMQVAVQNVAQFLNGAPHNVVN